MNSPLTFGQLSLWRGIQDLPLERRHEPNLKTVWSLPPGVSTDQVRLALAVLESRHPSLRTTLDVSNPAHPRQIENRPGQSSSVAAVAATESDALCLVTELSRQPFDLTIEYGWRFRIITAGGSATHLAMVHHHIACDGMGKGVLWEELRSELRQPGCLGPTTGSYSLIELAREQRSGAIRTKAAAAGRYWERALAASADGGIPEDRAGRPGAEVLQVCLRSRRSRSAAADIARQSGLSVPTVLLTAFALAIAEVQGVRSIPMRVLAANRYNPHWQNCVTTLGQWVPLHITVTPDIGFVELAERLQQGGMQAQRHGMYDPDLVNEIRNGFPARVAATEEVWAINHILDPLSPDPMIAAGEPDGAVVWEPAFQSLGPRFYLRATDNGTDTWALRLRTRGLSRAELSDLVRTTHELLLARSASPIG